MTQIKNSHELSKMGHENEKMRMEGKSKSAEHDVRMAELGITNMETEGNVKPLDAMKSLTDSSSNINEALAKIHHLGEVLKATVEQMHAPRKTTIVRDKTGRATHAISEVVRH